MQLTERHKKILKWAGYPLLAVVTFVTALHLTFPYHRVQDKVVEALSDKYDVTIASTEPTLLPGGIIFKGVALQTRPTKPDDKPTTIFLDEVRIDIGLFALIGGRLDVDFEAQIADGEVTGSVVVGKDELLANIETERLPLEDIPGLREAIGLPVQGGLNVNGWLKLPQKRWDKLDAKLTLSCPGCSMGDGETRLSLKPRRSRSGRIRQPVFSEGPVVPKLQLGNLAGTLEVDGGRGKFVEFGTNSVHGELRIYGGVRFGRKLKDSRFDNGSCMRFKLSEQLKTEEKEFGNFPELMGVPPNDDGTSNVSIVGKVSEMRWKPTRTCDPNQAGGGDRDDDDKPPTITSKRPIPPPRTSPLGATGFANGAADPGAARDDADDEPEPATDDSDDVAPGLRPGGERPPGLRGPGAADPDLNEAADTARRSLRRTAPRDDVGPPDSAGTDQPEFDRPNVTPRPTLEPDLDDDPDIRLEDERDQREFDDEREEGGDERDRDDNVDEG